MGPGYLIMPILDSNWSKVLSPMESYLPTFFQVKYQCRFHPSNSSSSFYTWESCADFPYYAALKEHPNSPLAGLVTMIDKINSYVPMSLSKA